MALEDNGFFSPGVWGFMEGWPRGAEAPVFDICHGEDHVVRLFKDKGEWRVVFRTKAQVSSDLGSLLRVLEMVGKRIEAFEHQGEEQSVGSPAAIALPPPRDDVRDTAGAVVQAFSQLLGRAIAAAGARTADQPLPP